MKGTVDYLKSNDMSLLVSDKEGGFVVMPKQLFLDKADGAIAKNVVQTRSTAARFKKQAISLCKHLDLANLEKRIERADRNGLTVFCSAKTHKPGVPLRAIVTEEGSWQGVLSRFLQKRLKRLPVSDPFRVANSMDVIGFFSHEGTGLAGASFAFSIDIVDLFCSIPQSEILSTVKESIESVGTVGFQNEAGISLGKSLTLLDFYLSSTFVNFEGGTLVQREGVCIGSGIAPVLSELFLARLDRRIEASIGDNCVLKTTRYVVDFL